MAASAVLRRGEGGDGGVAVLLDLGADPNAALGGVTAVIAAPAPETLSRYAGCGRPAPTRPGEISWARRR